MHLSVRVWSWKLKSMSVGVLTEASFVLVLIELLSKLESFTLYFWMRWVVGVEHWCKPNGLYLAVSDCILFAAVGLQFILLFYIFTTSHAFFISIYFIFKFIWNRLNRIFEFIFVVVITLFIMAVSLVPKKFTLYLTIFLYDSLSVLFIFAGQDGKP